jgi:hypothetical protein
MENDEAHAEQNALVDPLDHPIVDLLVSQVSPPCQHVCLGEDAFVKAVFRLVEGRGANVGGCAQMLADTLGNDRMHTRWIDFPDGRIAVFVSVLTPDGHA